MKNTQKKDEQKNMVMAGIAGAVAGGVAVAAAVAMSNKENQKKMKAAVTGAKDKVTGYIDDMTDKRALDKAAKAVVGKVTEIKKKIEAKM